MERQGYIAHGAGAEKNVLSLPQHGIAIIPGTIQP